MVKRRRCRPPLVRVGRLGAAGLRAARSGVPLTVSGIMARAVASRPGAIPLRAGDPARAWSGRPYNVALHLTAGLRTGPRLAALAAAHLVVLPPQVSLGVIRRHDELLGCGSRAWRGSMRRCRPPHGRVGEVGARGLRAAGSGAPLTLHGIIARAVDGPPEAGAPEPAAPLAPRAAVRITLRCT
jgi:hypothetical protein